MEKIKWNNDFSVGIDWLDEQHKQIIKMINQMIDCPDRDTKSETLHEILNQMFKYSINHLHDEEIMLIKENYSDIENHKIHHLRYSEKLAELSLKAAMESKGVGVEMLSFLSEWWNEHILIEDMTYKGIVQGH